MNALAEKVRAELAKISNLRDLQYGQPFNYPTVQIDVDRNRAGQFNLTVSDVAKSMVAATSSSRFVEPNFWRDPASGIGYKVQVEVPLEPRPIEHIYRLEGPNLWFLPAGRPPENPLELMQSGRLSKLMEQLAAWFDWIIIDSPPVLPLADASVWARLADGILLVTREGTTKRRSLQSGLQALELSKVLGVVVNSSESTDHANYYYRYGPTVKPKAEVLKK
jgi:hypothetical protein